jgi:hypothetical protein
MPISLPSISLSSITAKKVLSIAFLYQKAIIKSILIFGVLGYAISYFISEKFKVDASIMPELQTRSALALSRFGALAELTGINLDTDGAITEAVRPDLYPNILNSNQFRVEALNQPVVSLAGKKYPTLVAFLTDPSLSLSGKLLGGKSVAAFPILTTDKQPTLLEEDILLSLQNQIIADFDKQSGLIRVRVELTDPLIAAQIARFAVKYLEKYVSTYRTGKLNQNLVFLTRQQQQARLRYTQLKRQLAAYRDSHRAIFLQSASVDGEELEAETTVARNVLTDITRQYEQTRLLIQEQTPIFQVLEPPTPPARRSAPRRAYFVLFSAMVGIIATIGVGFVQTNHLQQS